MHFTVNFIISILTFAKYSIYIYSLIITLSLHECFFFFYMCTANLIPLVSYTKSQQPTFLGFACEPRFLGKTSPFMQHLHFYLSCFISRKYLDSEIWERLIIANDHSVLCHSCLFALLCNPNALGATGKSFK